MYQFISTMSKRAALLQIVPRLQDNETTAEAVAVAKTTLQKANVASLVVEGIEVILMPVGIEAAEAARKYLGDHKGNAKLKEVPIAVWTELESLAEAGAATKVNQTAEAANVATKVAQTAAASVAKKVKQAMRSAERREAAAMDDDDAVDMTQS